MNLDNYLSISEDLYYITSKFCNLDHLESLQKLDSGNINNTFLISFREEFKEQSIIIQDINSNIFHSPYKLVSNNILLNDHLNLKYSTTDQVYSKRLEITQPIRVIGSKELIFFYKNKYWRASKYIPSINLSENELTLKNSYEIGFALSIFHQLFYDFPSSKLHIILSDLHQTSNIVREYLNYSINSKLLTINNSVIKSRVINCIDYINKNLRFIDQVQITKEDNYTKGIIHSDPKVSNFLFDDYREHVVGLIDLDTVQLGYLLHDIGDCLRSICNPLGEECTKPSEVCFDLDHFDQAIHGYFSEQIIDFSESEIKLIPSIIKLITLELGIRFFLDFLKGDIYFKTSKKNHNLLRAEVQFSLAQSIDDQFYSMNEIVDLITSRY